MFRTGNNLTWQIKEGQQKDFGGGGVSWGNQKPRSFTAFDDTWKNFIFMIWKLLRAKGSLSLIQNVHF